MRTIGIKISLLINYFVFAILLNTVGTVMLQMQRNFGISQSEAGNLDAFKDLPIAISSFLLASFLPKIGIKNSMLIALGMVGVICLVMPSANAFWYFKMLFFVVGVSFALIKISVFTAIGLTTKDSKEHSSFMGFLEGVFMIGVLSGNVLFSWFIDDHDNTSMSWMKVYYVLSALSVLAFILLFFSKLDEKAAVKQGSTVKQDILDSLKILQKPLVLVFLISTFLFVLVEQSFQTWTPTFYNKILKVPASMGVQAGAVLAGAFAIGRLLSGYILRKITWINVIIFCIIGSAVSILLVLPLSHTMAINAHTNWRNAPAVIYLFPLIGIFLSPIYPTLNSFVLVSLPKYLHSSVSGLIVVFSAIGGTIGSKITGVVFQHYSGQTAFYLSIIPLFLLLISVIWMNKLAKLN